MTNYQLLSTLTEIVSLLRSIAKELNIVCSTSETVPTGDTSSKLEPLKVSPYEQDSLLFTITNILKELGGPCSILGFNYSREAIFYILKSENPSISMTKELYPEVAKKCNTTPSKVERSIRHFVEVICSRGNIEYINTLFSYSISSEKGKPTNSEFLYTIVDVIRNN